MELLGVVAVLFHWDWEGLILRVVGGGSVVINDMG